MDNEYIDDRQLFLAETMKNMDEGLYDNAIALADTRLSQFQGDMDAYLVKAACRSLMDKPLEAQEIVDQWLDIVLDQSRAFEILGDAYCRKGMSKEALESYIKFADLNPDPPASLRVSEKIASLQDVTIDEKLDDVSDESDDRNGNTTMFTNFHTITLAKLYVKQGHFKMAGEVLDRMLERDPNNVEAAEYATYVKGLGNKGWGPVVEELGRWLRGLGERRLD